MQTENYVNDYEITDIVEAQQLVESMLKTSKVNHTTFQKALKGLIDTYAAQKSEYYTRPEYYAQVISFCGDRLFAIEKQRKTVKILKAVASEYSSRNEYVQENVMRRVNEHVSVGEHQFTAFKPEYLSDSTDKLAAIENALEWYGSERMTAKQSKLTSIVRSIQKELLGDKLANVLTRSEKDKITEAASIISGIKRTVVHAKERKIREEKRKEIEKQNRQRACKNAVKEVFDIEKMPLVELVNLAFTFSETIENKYWHDFQSQHLIENIIDLKKNKYFNFYQRDLRTNAIDQLSVMAEKAWQLQADLSYKKIGEPITILQIYFDQWKARHCNLVAEKYHSQIQLVDEVIQELKTNEQN